MKRNIVLVITVIIALVLAYNSFKRIKDFRLTAKTVADREEYLDLLKKENDALKKDLEYKESSQFAELEIRNKLGLAKPGETVVIVPKEDMSDKSQVTSRSKPNWQKWKELLFGI